MKQYKKLDIQNAPKVIILANGAFPHSKDVLQFIDEWASGESAYRLICCDGAVNKLQAYTNVLPDAVVGDLDSVSPELKSLLADRLHHFPSQDINDLTKAMRYVTKSLKAKSVLLLGASGERDDHFLANIALLPTYVELVDDLIMLTDQGAFYLVKDEASFDVVIGQQVSVFNFSQSPITLKGVHWALEEAVLPELWCGTLNRADEPLISLKTTTPSLLYLANECKP